MPNANSARMERSFKFRAMIVAVSFCIVLLSSAVPKFADASMMMYVSPASGSYANGENFSVPVYVDADTSINAVTASLSFPTSLLKVVALRKDDSIIDLWTLEPSFANSGGTGNVTFEGVVLNPGFIGAKGKILTVVFAPQTTGTASISFDRSSTLANDGKGTSLPVTNAGATYTLTPAKPQPPASKSAAKVAADSSPSQVVIIREVAGQGSLDKFWESIPSWMRMIILFSIGLTTILFGFIVISLAILILIWVWSNVWHRRMQVVVSLRLLYEIAKQSVRQLVSDSERNTKEVWGDTQYLFDQLKQEFVLTQSNHSLSFVQLLMNYFQFVGRIARRFTTRQEPQNYADFGVRSPDVVDKFSSSFSVSPAPKTAPTAGLGQGGAQNIKADIDQALSE